MCYGKLIYQLITIRNICSIRNSSPRSIWMGGKWRPWKTQRHGRGMGGLCCHWNIWELSVLCCNNLWVNYPYPFSEVTSIIILNFNYTKSLESIILLLLFPLNILNYHILCFMITV